LARAGAGTRPGTWNIYWVELEPQDWLYCKRGIWSIQFYLDYRAVREGLIKGHPPSPSQHGKRVIREEDKGALSPFKSSPGSLELHFTTDQEGVQISRNGIGMNPGRPPEQRKRELTSLQRMD